MEKSTTNKGGSEMAENTEQRKAARGVLDYLGKQYPKMRYFPMRDKVLDALDALANQARIESMELAYVSDPRD